MKRILIILIFIPFFGYSQVNDTFIYKVLRNSCDSLIYSEFPDCSNQKYRSFNMSMDSLETLFTSKIKEKYPNMFRDFAGCTITFEMNLDTLGRISSIKKAYGGCDEGLERLIKELIYQYYPSKVIRCKNREDEYEYVDYIDFAIIIYPDEVSIGVE